MLFASLINHHAVHQIQVPHGNFISYGEKTDRGRVTYFFFLFLFSPFFSSSSLFIYFFLFSLVMLVKIAGLCGILITFMGQPHTTGILA